jgi:2-amino-4-hydroxy-6-hydroxymethyldihydropteridine diphosphokinase
VTRAWIALGSNLGDRDAWLHFGVQQLAEAEHLRIVRHTAVQETAPLGGRDQERYLNSMVLVEWSGTPASLLTLCQGIEEAAGRERTGHWASRTLDLDLVRFDGALCDGAALTLPHPGLRDRPFWWTQLAALETDG